MARRITGACRGRRVYVRVHPEDRFMAMVSKRDDGCWEWTGSRLPAGYGRFSFDGVSMGLAHRFAYQRFRGPLIDGMNIDHLCRNTWCVNPAHLEQVTPAENNVRSVPYRRTHSEQACVNGHPWTDSSRYVKADGSVNCRTCRNISAAKYRDQKRAEHPRKPHASKLSEADVAEARRLRGAGVLQAEIARKLGVDASTISRAVRGESWRRIA